MKKVPLAALTFMLVIGSVVFAKTQKNASSQDDFNKLAQQVAAMFEKSNETSQIFVSPDGNDSNPGTKEKPFATITAARDAVRSLIAKGLKNDVVVYLRGGSYRISDTVVFSLADSAPEGKSITYAAFGDEEPIITSGQKITGWKKLKKNPAALAASARGKVYVADVAKTKGGKWSFKTLYSGEEMLARARSKGFEPTETGVIREKRWEVRDTLHFPKGVLKNWSNLEDVEILIRPNHQWLVNYLPLASVDVSKGIAKTAIQGTYRLSDVKNKPWHDTCWVENVLEELDEPGEWVLNTQEGRLYLWPKTDKPEDIYAPRLRELFLVEGKNVEALTGDVPVNGITFKGLTFTCADRDVWTNADKGIQHDWDMYDKDNAMVRFRGAVNCSVEDCTFRNAGSSAVRADLYAQNCRITGNHIYNLGGTAVLLCGYGPGLKDVNKGHLVQNNHIHHTATLFWHAPGIFVWQSGDTKILNNYIHHLPYDGIVLSGVRPRYFDIIDPVKWTQKGLIPRDLRENMLTIRWDEVGTPQTAADVERFAHTRNTLVQDNEMHDVLQTLGDGNAIYFSCAGYNNVVRRNLIYNSPGAHNEIRFDDDQQESVVEDNIVFGGGILLKHRNRITNNVIVGYLPEIVFKNETEVGSKVENNILYKLGSESQPYFFAKPTGKHNGYDIMKRANSDKNLFYAKDTSEIKAFLVDVQGHGLEKNSIIADPLFVDLEKGDVRLRANSPALKLGMKSIDITKIGLLDDPAYLRLKEMGLETFYGPKHKKKDTEE